jgi:hypothetical protein
MLSLFDPISVPGVEHITVFRDDQDQNKYYMLPEMPTISRLGGDKGALQFSLVVFARDFHLMQDAAKDLSNTETEGGLFSMTTELSVSEADQQKILNHLRFNLKGLSLAFQSPGKFLLKTIDSLVNSPITLAYPTWVDGSVSFSLLPSGGATFIKGEEGSAKPSLMTTNLANYSAMLGQEGVELVRSMLDKGMTPGSIDYSVSFMARIPSLTVSVKGNMSDVYQQIRQICPIRIYRNRRYYAYPAFDSLKDVETRITALTIKVTSTDFTGSAPTAAPGTSGAASSAAATSASSTASGIADQIESKLNDLAFGIIQDILKNQFCTPSFSSQAASDDANSGDSSGSDSNTPPTDQRNWMKPGQSMTGTLDVEITYDKNIPVTKNPGCSLLTLCTAEEAKQRIVMADLSDPYFQILDVSVQVTADFENDPIAAIKIFMDYNQTDEATGQAKTETQEYMFTTGKEVYRFQTVMAKAKDGSPKDSYTYHSEIIYKASNQPEKTPEVTTRDRALIIGYNQLSCVRVQTMLGAVPTDVVDKVQVHFQYPGLNSPTASKDIYLSADHGSDSWFTYTNGNASMDYQATVTYLLKGGQQMPIPMKTINSNTFIVNSPFADTLRVTFAPQGQFPPIASILLTVRYEDKANNYIQEATHSFTSLEDSWLWTLPIVDKTKRSYQYRVMITNADGSSDQGDWLTASDTTLLVGQTAKQMLEVDLVSSLLDLQKQWKLVIARLHYQDDANHIEQDQIFQITGANAGQPLSWKIPLKNPAMKSYSYRVDAYGYDSANNKSIGPVTTEDPLLVLEL